MLRGKSEDARVDVSTTYSSYSRAGPCSSEQGSPNSTSNTRAAGVKGRTHGGWLNSIPGPHPLDTRSAAATPQPSHSDRCRQGKTARVNPEEPHLPLEVHASLALTLPLVLARWVLPRAAADLEIRSLHLRWSRPPVERVPSQSLPTQRAGMGARRAAGGNTSLACSSYREKPWGFPEGEQRDPQNILEKECGIVSLLLRDQECRLVPGGRMMGDEDEGERKYRTRPEIHCCQNHP